MELNDVPISNARQSLADSPLYGCCSDGCITTMADGALVLEVGDTERHWLVSGRPDAGDTLQPR